MSTQRFPRSKFVRRLLAMEVELLSWADYLRKKKIATRLEPSADGWDERCTAMWTIAQDIHSLADDMANLPGAAQRRYRRQANAAVR